MKTVGFIDYYLNEWHADNYPNWIKEYSGGEFEVKYAYGHIEPPIAGLISNEEWAKKQGIELVASMEELVQKSHCIIVLSPDNSEMHFELSKLALESGKPVFIDKTFADSKAEAEKIFAIAEKSGSPCFSSSALRFSEILGAVDKTAVNSVISMGCGPDTDIYIIHQLEPIVTLMGSDVKKVMYLGNQNCPSWQLVFADGRTASIAFLNNEWGYTFRINHAAKNEMIKINDDFFKFEIMAMLEMFRTGKEPIPHSETIAIMAIREACINAKKTPLEWVSVG